MDRRVDGQHHETEELLRLALRMANRADEIALSGFLSRPQPIIKDDGSPVTRVDREVESALREMIDIEHPCRSSGRGVWGEGGDRPLGD